MGSDYINANYIDGVHSNSKQAYIATQAPKPDTMEDFWRMCWEQNVQIIVMLTNLEEGGRVKAHQYWPKLGTKQFGSWSVTVVSTQDNEAYIIRTIELKKGFGGGLYQTRMNLDDDTLDKRIIYQYHYLVWPDMGVPEDPTSLLQLMDDVNQHHDNPDKSPLVVHCSAGIGRTGTYVIIDTIIKKYREEEGLSIDSLDLQPILSNMRDQRPGFVQQKIQYYFCYQAVRQSLTGEKITIDPSKLPPPKPKKRDRPSKHKREKPE
jgi:protein tyrosine phosphatase